MMIHFNVRWRVVPILLLAFTIIAGLETGCQQREKQIGPPEKMTVAYSKAFNAVLFNIAFVNGYFTQEGLEVNPQAHDFGKPALQSVTDGKADVATVADTPIMFAILNAKKITILAAIETANRNTAIVSRKDRGIAEPSDLKGKTIGVALGTTGDFFTEAFLMAHGIDRKELRIIDMTPDEMAAALTAGKIDAASVWNPALIKMQNDLGNEGRTFYGEMLYTETFCVVAAQDYAKEHPEAIKKFLRALIKAETFVHEHPEESRRLVTEFLKTDKTLLDKVWEVYNFRVTLDQALIVDLEDQTRWSIKYRLTTNRTMPNYLDFIYVDGLQAIMPGAVTIIR